MKEMTIKAGSYAEVVIRKNVKAESVGADMQVRLYVGGEIMLTLSPGTIHEMGIMLSRGDVQRLMEFLGR